MVSSEQEWEARQTDTPSSLFRYSKEMCACRTPTP